MPRHLLDSLYDKMLTRLGLALLALALLINLGALIAMGTSADSVEDARERAIQTRAVEAEIREIRLMLLAAESAQRGFLYTDNKDYLRPVNENESRIMSRLARVREMVADNPERQKVIDRVRTIAQEKLAELNKTIAVQQMGQKDAARAIVMTDQGKQLMEAIDTEMSAMLRQEGLLRLERMDRWADIQVARRWGFVLILLINALLLIAGTITIMRDMARKRAEVVRLDERATVLASEVAQRAEELRALTAYLLRVQEEERRTIARELHDELGGTLSAVKMDIMMGGAAAAKRGDEKSVVRLQRAHSSIDSAIQFTRRLIEDLRPTLLDNLGFEAALRAMTEQFSERAACACVVTLPDGELSLTSAQSTALYRICQEALTNVLKYARAKQVTITLTTDGSQWKLLLADNGVGLDTTKQHRSISHGLVGMRERLVALGGTFDIRGAAGHGTTLTATFPVVESEPAPL
ncbi:MAG: CHASE3 domain-containing protein [Phycisphaerae bacterium]|nr:CHASE3 domain-containing protein [Gemmatimonadaceae bacterium]